MIALIASRSCPALKQKFGYKNALAVPRLEKIVISMGLGKLATAGEQGQDRAGRKRTGRHRRPEAGSLQGQEERRELQGARRQETGLKVTLRGTRMYEFLDRLIALAIPRVKDFRGLDPNGFDKDGNYNFGFTEQTVFPEVDSAAVTFQQGMNITMVTTARNPEQGRELLKQFGFPVPDGRKGNEGPK